jgi:MerR family transcriptional regulator, light-induced transcriptional regulator
MEKSENFSIRQMVELTGLSEFTIRGWENRYSAFSPQRSNTGRREYSKSDIERALLLRELLKRGHKIGNVAKLKDQKLKSIFEETEAKSEIGKKTSVSDEISKAMELMALQKWPELKELIKKIPTDNKIKLVHEFFMPALISLASKVEAGFVSIAQEHIFSSFLKEKIYTSLAELESKKKTSVNKKIQFVLATPEGDYHDIGLLMAHLLIRSYGFVSLYLGPHSPAKDLSETALRFEASHLLIVSTVSKQGGARQEILSYVSEVQKKIGAHLKILVAGGQAPLLPQNSQSSLSSMESFQQLENYLKTLGGQS